jgi:hypothetical protein
MNRSHATLPFGRFAGSLPSLAALALIVLAAPTATAAPEETQTFHIAEITKILVGYNGNANIQAVEIKFTAGGQNLVAGMSIAVYNGAGALVATLGTFPADVPNGVNGDHVLCATAAFQTAFGITPDLVIAPGIPVTDGQVSYEKATCRVNAIPYGAVTTPLTSPTAAPPLPSGGATALVRAIDDPTSITCPNQEDAAARLQLTSGSSVNRLVFLNNARESTQVWTSVSGVDATPPPAPGQLRAAPNPFSGSTRFTLPPTVARVTIYDISGRVVRRWEAGAEGTSWGGIGRAWEWNGLDDQSRSAPSGLYFAEAEGAGETLRGRVLLLR